MNVRHIPSTDLANIDLVPQAVIAKPVSFFEKRLGIQFIESHDDLDSFAGVALYLNDTLPIALRHYRGHPPGTTTVYLSRELRDVEEISRTICAIIDELKIPRDCIQWQRSNNPDL